MLTRSHQTLIWTRRRQANVLRSALREFYPGALAAFGDNLTDRDALAVLAAAPPRAGAGAEHGPDRGRAAPGRAQRNIETRAARIQAALRTEQLGLAPGLADAYAATVSAYVAVIRELNHQIESLEQAVGSHFGRHPDAAIVLSQPGLGAILGARVLAEFGDAPGVTPTPRPARTTPGPARSPAPPAPNGPSWPATPATDAWPTRSTNKPSPPCAAPRGTGLLRPPPRRRRQPPPSPTCPEQPPRRHPPRLPEHRTVSTKTLTAWQHQTNTKNPRRLTSAPHSRSPDRARSRSQGWPRRRPPEGHGLDTGEHAVTLGRAQGPSTPHFTR